MLVQQPGKAHAVIFGANLIYGLNYVIAKLALTAIPAFALVLTRVIIPLFFFWLITRFTEHTKVEKKDHPMLLLCGFLGVAANQLMFIKGLDLTSEIHASLIMITTPILVLLISAWFLKELFTWQKIAGVLLGAIGVYILMANKSGNPQSEATLVGDLLIMGNAASYAFFLVLAKPLMHKYPPLTVTTWLFFYGLLMVLPFGLTEIQDVPWLSLQGPTLWSWLYVVLISTCLVYILNILGLKWGNPTLVSIYIYAQPLLASVIAVITQTDVLSWSLLIAAICIFPGVALVSFSDPGKRNQTDGVTSPESV